MPLSTGMKRIVIVNSYEGTKEALITRGTDFAGRPTDSIHLKIHSSNFSSVAWSDYTKSNIFIRKLATKSLHLYGTGMANIEEIIIEGVEKMCSILCKETDKPIKMRTYLGKNIKVGRNFEKVCLFSKHLELRYFLNPKFKVSL